jgi:predicted site-specific integrase-resolvase
MAEELITTAQAARILGIDRSTLARCVQQGIVTPAWATPRGQHRWDLDDLRRQLREARQRDE